MILANPLLDGSPEEAKGEHVTPLNDEVRPCSRSTTANSGDLLGIPEEGSSANEAVTAVDTPTDSQVSKSQRKEKRATKTLGVVVGVFLICWVPFFFINIVNAICILMKKEFCQVGFDLFFYCTWIGYMNSFMNPIIYTIFNTEFRRAFKSILVGKDGRSGLQKVFLQKQVHV
ncbi:unnamed protein product [Haemonchus placei]|uniref:G_PROTEIN_RECEP_F1_2 domain-containing protein n=1 Tax=Haemonchus placei TaxID=6290 RepID=A0A158QMV0_HAEPC|nr:unnamed protein product [Haemonchus placei]